MSENETPHSKTKRVHTQTIGILKSDRKKMKWISFYVMIQCIVVFAGAATVLECVYKPHDGLFEIDVLARIMYLYDTEACGAEQMIAKEINELVLSDATYGLAVVPIQRRPVLLTVLTKNSGKMRRNLKMSCAVHAIWLLGALVLRVYSITEDLDYLKMVLKIFYCMTILVTCFDISMAVVYIAHIQQSMTKAMILRYSGWGMAPGVKHTENFGGWVPLIASACWMRGVLIMLLNIYCCRVLQFAFSNIKKREVKRRMKVYLNEPFPELPYEQNIGHTTYLKTEYY